MAGQTAIWIDGVSAAALPLPDRGLDFGDGLFETLLLRGGEALFVDLHLQRLQSGLQALFFPDCLGQFRAQLSVATAALAVDSWRWAALRITVTRGTGPRGYTPPLKAQPRIIALATALEHDPGVMLPPASLSLADLRWPTQPALAGLKHLNRLEQVLAARQCRAEGADETIMLDQDGKVISVAAGNLFVRRGKQLLTSPLQECGIAGTRRQLVMQRWAPAIGLEVAETALTLADVETADELFYTNSVVGVRPVASFGERHWQAHDASEALFRQYQKAIT